MDSTRRCWRGGGTGVEEFCENDREVWKGEMAYVEAWDAGGNAERSWT